MARKLEGFARELMTYDRKFFETMDDVGAHEQARLVLGMLAGEAREIRDAVETARLSANGRSYGEAAEAVLSAA